MRRAVLITMILAIAVNSWSINIRVEYNNPLAITALQIPYLKISLRADYQPVSSMITGVKLNISAPSKIVQEMINNTIISYVRTCDLTTKMPIEALSMCLLNAMKSIIGITNFEIKHSNVVQGVTLSGIPYLSYSSSIKASVANEEFQGLLHYTVKAYAEGPQEVLEIVMAKGGAYLKLTGTSEVSETRGFYTLISWRTGKGILVTTAPPLSPPAVIGNGPVTVEFRRPIVKYVITVDNNMNTKMLYFMNPVSRVVLPFNNVVVKLLPSVMKQVKTLCTLNVAVLRSGQHVIELNGAGIRVLVKSKAFSYASLPVPCNGTVLLRVDDSYALLNLSKVVDKKVIVLPTSPVLRLVYVKFSQPAAVVVNGTEVECGTECYLLLPPEQVELNFVGLVSRTSTVAIFSPTSSEVSVKFPPSALSKGCLVKFVAPKQIRLTISTGTSLFTVNVGRAPYTVVLPCKSKTELVVGSYRASIIVRNGEWVYLCPSPYAVRGEAIMVNTTMKPPLSVSCDGGSNWAIVNNSTFVMVKPKYSYIELKVVSPSGASADVVVPEGVKTVKLVPTRMPVAKKTLVPLSSLNAIEKIIVSGVRNARVVISNGTQYLDYVVSGTSYVALPSSWLRQRLTVVLKTPEGMVINSTIPRPLEYGVLAPIYIIANKTMIVHYHSIKIALFRGGSLAQAPVIINGHKVLVNGTLILVLPEKVVRVQVGNKVYEVYANGRTFNITLPKTSSVALTLPLEVSLLLNGSPVKGLLRFVIGNYTIAYEVFGNATVLLPQSAINATVRLSVATKSAACTVTLPPLLTKIGTTKLVSPLLVYLKDGNPCYAYKIVVVSGKFFKRPAAAKIWIDGKRLTVSGSVILVYYKPTLSIKYDHKSLVAVAGGTIYITVTKKAPSHVVKSNVTKLVSVVSAIKKAGKWNPVGELPGMLSLAMGMLLALGVLNSGVTPNTPLYATAFVLASLSMIIGLVTLAIILTRYFAT